jgi:tripartite-type tricarboxylate transporter receptor subunit TctC
MTLHRRSALGLGLAAFAAPLAAPALAQPARPMARIVVGFPAGGSADTTARLIAERLRGPYAQNVIVENRVGAAGRLAVEAVKAAEPDGNTILLTAASMLVIFPHLYRPATLRYDPFIDLMPVTPAGEFPFGMGVGPMANSVGTLAAFKDWGTGKTDIPYSSAAAGSMLHFLGVQVAKATGLSMTHIPYRGSAPAIQDLLGGRLAASYHPMVDLAPHAAAPGGPVRLAGVSSEQRLPRFPDVPTFAEQGYPQLTGSEWFGLFLPARTPGPVQEALHRAAVEAIATPDYREAIARLEMRPYPLSIADFTRRFRADFDKWAPIIAESGFRPEET